MLAEDSQFEESLSSWRRHRTTGHLGDLLGFALVPEFHDELVKAVQEAMDVETGMTVSQRHVVDSILNRRSDDHDDGVIDDDFAICNPHVRAEVRELRSLLRINPQNPLVLLDYAQMQLAAGKRRACERSLRGALALSPNSRVALRTLARFHVHDGDPERAHSLIRRHPRTQSDPWLMASEIALAAAAGVSPVNAARGKRLLKGDDIAAYDKTELAGAIGSLELTHGHVKYAREFFRIALLLPNDNVLAQAITDRPSLGINIGRNRVADALSVGEPDALLAWQAGDVMGAERGALRWHSDEPFSSRPLQCLTTLYAITRHHQRALNLGRRGLISNPNDIGLLTNYAYSLAALGRLEDAVLAINRLLASGGSECEPYAAATRGLIAMRRKEFDAADALYEEALTTFTRARSLQLVAVCFAYYARAAADEGHPRASEIWQRAIDAFTAGPSTDAALLLNDLDASLRVDTNEASDRRLEQWVFNPTDNTLVKRSGVTQRGAPPLLIETSEGTRS